MKILSEDFICTKIKDTRYLKSRVCGAITCTSCGMLIEVVAKAQLDKVRELLDGIENPLLWSRAEDFNRAIQTIKALLEE